MNIIHGLGLYRNKYKEHGVNFWGQNPGSLLRKINDFIDIKNYPKTVLDLGCGTGKNIFYLIDNFQVDKVTAVDIDSIAIYYLLEHLVNLENKNSVKEGLIDIHKMDCHNFLCRTDQRYDLIIAYGLLHVFESLETINTICNKIDEALESGGILIIQFLTNKYPAPEIQPELNNVIINELEFKRTLASKNWEVLFEDHTDITHSHKGSNHNHKHGSCRYILKKS